MDREVEHYDVILQSCLEQVLKGQETLDSVVSRYPLQADTLRAEIQVALLLSSRQAAFDPRPGYISASKRRLVARIQRETARTEEARREKVWWRQAGLRLKGVTMQLVLAALLIVVFFFTVDRVAAASVSSIPGDTFYPVKTAIEQAQLAVTFDDARAMELRIEFAHRRIAEMDQLALEGRYDEILATSSAFEAQIQASLQLLAKVEKQNPARARELANSLQTTLDEQANTLNVILSIVPENSQAGVRQAIKATQAASSATKKYAKPTESPETSGSSSPTENPTRETGNSGNTGVGQQKTPEPQGKKATPVDAQVSVTLTVTTTTGTTETQASPGEPKPSHTPKPKNTPGAASVSPTEEPAPTNPPAPTKESRPSKTPRAPDSIQAPTQSDVTDSPPGKEKTPSPGKNK